MENYFSLVYLKTGFHALSFVPHHASRKQPLLEVHSISQTGIRQDTAENVRQPYPAKSNRNPMGMKMREKKHGSTLYLKR
jgi:hypothetical protein